MSQCRFKGFRGSEPLSLQIFSGPHFPKINLIYKLRDEFKKQSKISCFHWKNNFISEIGGSLREASFTSALNPGWIWLVSRVTTYGNNSAKMIYINNGATADFHSYCAFGLSITHFVFVSSITYLWLGNLFKSSTLWPLHVSIDHFRFCCATSSDLMSHIVRTHKMQLNCNGLFLDLLASSQSRALSVWTDQCVNITCIFISIAIPFSIDIENLQHARIDSK